MRHETPFKRPRNRARSRPLLPFGSRGVLLSRGELAFFRALRRALAGRFLIAFKVRAADLLSCSSSAWEAGFGHMIARHHLDFVLCEPDSTEIHAAIELDDRSHCQANRKRRDSFLNEAFAAAKIPLIRFQAAARYDPVAIARVIERSQNCQGPPGLHTAENPPSARRPANTGSRKAAISITIRRKSEP